MIRLFLALAAALLSTLGLASEADVNILEVFQTHCLQCHGQNGKVKGKVNLQRLRAETDLAAEPELLASLIEVIDFAEMPPEEEEPLDETARIRLITALKSIQAQAIDGRSHSSHTPMRRMTRFQYNSAVVDLFDLNSVVFSLPERMMREHRNYFRPETEVMADTVTVGSRPLGKSQMIENRLAGVAAFPQDLRAEHGFDNRGDHLSLSPLLMESFLKLAQSIVESSDFNAKNVGLWESFFAPSKTNLIQEEEIKRRLEPFLTKAFRRPVTSDALNRYAAYAQQEAQRQRSLTKGMKAVAAAALSSPRFLYLYDEYADSPGEQEVDAFELASRLSFFLWGSLPDEELLALAKNGQLTDRDTLSRQVDRMLRDQKLKRFCDSFPSQWLQLERIVSSTPDPKQYPDFYFLKYRDSMHMMMEPLLLFETVLIENLPVTQFIHSDFTYRSSLLEEAYGDLALDPAEQQVRNEVTVLNFKRLPVTDQRSGGLITNAAVMTMTSGPERTQPITRGAWLAGVIFNNPPEPPPADVPPLDEKPNGEDAHLTLRERLTQHRERSDCRGCHEQIDPLGFALENYDPIGQWRTHYQNGREIDSAGRLLRKYPFQNIPEFKAALLEEKDRFTRALASHLLAYGLARGLSAADSTALDTIVENTRNNDYHFKTLIKEVILSHPFQHKSNPPE